MKNTINIHLKTLALCLGLAVTAQPTSVDAYNNTSNTKTGLTVLGRATKMVKCDRAVFEVSLTVSGDCLQEINQNFSQQSEQLKTYWQSLGLKEDSIIVGTPTLAVSELEYNGNKKRNKYALSASITILITDVDSAENVQRATMAFIEKGFLLNNHRIVYQYTKVESLQKSLQKEALLDGKTEAMAMANTLGMTISTQPLQISESIMTCHSETDNPAPYEKYGYSVPKLNNTFVVLVPMSYKIIDKEMSDQKTAQSPA